MSNKFEKLIVWLPSYKMRFIARTIRDRFYAYDKLVPHGEINIIEIDLARHCNMACYSCSHFSQLSDKDFYDFNTFKKDIKRLYEVTNGKISLKTNIDINGRQNKYKRFIECESSGTNCVQLFNGKIYICPISANIHSFNKYFNMNIPITESNSIDIYNSSFDEILDYLYKPKDICRYCAKEEIAGDWRPSKKQLSEYLLDK